MLQERINALYRTAHELLNLGADDEPIYADRFSELNWDVRRQSVSLLNKRGSSTEEEAALCVALFIAFKAMSFDYGDREEKIQLLLDRSWKILELLPQGLLKCQLLVGCYGEFFDKELAEEAHGIIRTWAGEELLEEQKEVIEDLKVFEENEYSWEKI